MFYFLPLITFLALLFNGESFAKEPKIELVHLEAGQLEIQNFPPFSTYYLLRPSDFVKKIPLKVSLRLYDSADFYDLMGSEPLFTKVEGEETGYIVVMVDRLFPGQTATFRFESYDKSFLQEVDLTPFPLIFSSEEGKVALKAELSSLDPVSYLLSVEGVDKEEAYTLFCQAPNFMEQATLVGPQADFLLFFGEECPQEGQADLQIRFKERKRMKTTLPFGRALISHFDTFSFKEKYAFKKFLNEGIELKNGKFYVL